MKLLNIFLTFVYTTIFLMLGFILILFGFHLQGAINLSELFLKIKNMPNLGLTSIASGFLIVLLNLTIIRAMFSKFQREKTIAFNNPNGQVLVSLVAIEDYIKKSSANIREIKEIRANVIAGKKGIDISARVTLWSDTNIPEATDKIQSMIKNSLQEMLGIEEAITVKVHIHKIAQREMPRAKKEEVQQPYKDVNYGRR